GDFRGLPAVVATGNCSGTVRCVAVSVNVQENISFDPPVGAVEVEAIVLPSAENVLDEVNDRLAGAVSAGKIHDVIVTEGAAKKVSQKNAVATAFDPARSMHRLELSRRSRKQAMADDERRSIYVNVRRGGVAEGQMIEKRCARGDLDARRPGRVRVELEMREDDAGLRRADAAIDRDIAPVAARSAARESNR